MPRNVPKGELESRILDGIETANKFHYDIGGLTSLLSAPEYFLTVHIAHEIARDGQCWVTFENNVAQTISEGGGLRRGRPCSGLRENGRSDIIVWYKNSTPRAIVEVKHRVSGAHDDIMGDVTRLCSIMNSIHDENSLQFCCLAFWIGVDRTTHNPNPEERISEILNEKLERANMATRRDLLARMIGPRISVEDNGAWAWSPAGIIIERG